MRVIFWGGQLIINEKNQGWEVYLKDGDIKAFMLLNNPMVNSTIMLRNQPNFWGTKVKYNVQHQRAEDYEFWLDCVKENLIFANLEIPLISYLQDTNRPADSEQLNEAMQTRESAFEFYAKGPIEEDIKLAYHQFANKEKLDSTQSAKVQGILLAIFPNKEDLASILKNHQSNRSWLQRLKFFLVK